MAKEKKEAKKEEMIRLADKVTIIAQKGAKHLKAGEEYQVHPKIAEHLVEKGYAALKKEE